MNESNNLDYRSLKECFELIGGDQSPGGTTKSKVRKKCAFKVMDSHVAYHAEDQSYHYVGQQTCRLPGVFIRRGSSRDLARHDKTKQELKLFCHEHGSTSRCPCWCASRCSTSRFAATWRKQVTANSRAGGVDLRSIGEQARDSTQR